MRRIILDTDVASLSIKDRVPTPLLRPLVGAQVGITFVTLGEMTRWAIIRQWAPLAGASWTPGWPPAPRSPTPTTWRVWGEISAHATRRGRPRPQNDTWVAAACIAYDLPLATLNIKDFRDFAEHEGLVLVEP